MSDLDKLTALLDSFGVEYYTNTRKGLFNSYQTTTEDQDAIIITTEMEDTTKVGGYTNFYTNFEFDKDGKFISMGAWE